MSNQIEAQVVTRKKGLLLVEYRTGTKIRRNWVTPSMVVEDSGPSVIVESIEEGVPYGIDYTTLFEPSISAEDVDYAFKSRGLWTIDDLRNNPQAIHTALRDLYGIDLAEILKAATRLENEMKEQQNDAQI